MSPDHSDSPELAHVKSLIRLLHVGNPAEPTACALVTALVLSIWQLSGGAFSILPPSFLLVNGSDRKDIVFDALIELMEPHFTPAFSKQVPGESESLDLNSFRSNPNLARQTMRAARATRKKLAGKIADEGKLLEKLAPWLRNWQQCKGELFPAVEINHYRKEFDEDFGLVTGDDDYISLMIHGVKGRQALRKDLLQASVLLKAPPGFNNHLERVVKRASLMGTIPAQEWDAALANATQAIGRPLICLPHDACSEIPTDALTALTATIFVFNRLHRKHPGRYFTDSADQPNTSKFRVYEGLVTRMSEDLPGDSAFLHRTLIRQLGTVIHRFVQSVAPASYGNLVVTALEEDLFHTCLRGIAYGLALPRFHGRGLGLGSFSTAAADILEFLREKGQISRRDIQRKVYTLQSGTRDHLLERLEDAGLLVTEGKMVHAVAFSGFLTDIPTRERFPTHELTTTSLLGEF
jgi:hypothetical protein